MASHSNQGLSTQKPDATKTELSQNELANVTGGFNPQPDPPGIVAKQILDFGIRLAVQSNSR